MLSSFLSSQRKAEELCLHSKTDKLKNSKLRTVACFCAQQMATICIENYATAMSLTTSRTMAYQRDRDGDRELDVEKEVMLGAWHNGISTRGTHLYGHCLTTGHSA